MLYPFPSGWCISMGRKQQQMQHVRLAQLTFVVSQCAIDKGRVLLEDFTTDSERRRVARQVFYKILFIQKAVGDQRGVMGVKRILS